ncbi:MAG: hypothetical protein JWN93_3540 [Hyphomicrobiales bacterium]|nr:hypothetical protein [Hyphomicrobiales bacterium]
MARESAAPPPSKALEALRENPKADWTINDLRRICDQIGLLCASPSRGSHYKMSSRYVAAILTVPARRPIKPVYIKLFVSLAQAHLAAAFKDTDHG